jgi:hypothetical protein
MFVYRLTEPIDIFDGLTPLNEWLGGHHPGRTAWALQAVLALNDAANEVGWRGDMRYLPMVGGLPTPTRTTPYLIIEQDNNGDTFLVTTTEIPDIDWQALTTKVTTRDIGTWAPDDNDGAQEPAF